MQIFLELGFFRKAVIRPMLETIVKIEGYSTLCLEGRDTLDAVTLARIFMGYVTGNHEGKETRIVSIGFTLESQAQLHLLFHDVLSPYLSFDLALSAVLYDPEGLFRFRDFAAPEELKLPTLKVGCDYNGLFKDRDKPIDWGYVDFGLPPEYIAIMKTKKDSVLRKKWIHAEFGECEKTRGSTPLLLMVGFFLRPDQTVDDAVKFCTDLAAEHNGDLKAKSAEKAFVRPPAFERLDRWI